MPCYTTHELPFLKPGVALHDVESATRYLQLHSLDPVRGVSGATLILHTRTGKVKSYKIGFGRFWLQHDLDTFLDLPIQRGRPPNPPA